MATLENRNGWYRLIFRYGGKKVCKSLRTQDSRKANVRLLKRLRLGEAVVPDLLDPISFIAGESEPIASAGNSRQTLLREQQLSTSGGINTAWTFFLESIPNNSIEESTLKGMATLKSLNRLIKCNKLSLNEEFTELKDGDAWEAFTNELRALTWVSHIQAPPNGCDTAISKRQSLAPTFFLILFIYFLKKFAKQKWHKRHYALRSCHEKNADRGKHTAGNGLLLLGELDSFCRRSNNGRLPLFIVKLKFGVVICVFAVAGVH